MLNVTPSININVDGPIYFCTGPLSYNSHLIVYGVAGDEWEIKCASCSTSISGDMEVLHQLDKCKYPVFWLWKMKEFDYECTCGHDNWSEMVEDDILINYIGDPKTQDTKHRISKEIEDIYIGPVDVDVDLS